MTKIIKKDGKIILINGASDKDADWIKYVNKGISRLSDLEAHTEAERLHKEEQKKPPRK